MLRVLKRKIKDLLFRLGYGIYQIHHSKLGPLNIARYSIFKIPGYAKDYYDFPYLRHRFFKMLFEKISNINGDVVECGIGFGTSFLCLAWISHVGKKERTVWGFDSFEGFPEPSIFDQSPRNLKKGQWAVSDVKGIYDLLKGRMEPSYVKENVNIVKGFFDKSLKEYKGESVVFLHLDVDLYASYKTTLEYFWPKMAKGGVVVFDEYKQSEVLINFPGAKKAIDEFFGEMKKEIQWDRSADKYYIFKR